MPKYMKRKRTYKRSRKSYRKKRGATTRALGINRVVYAKQRLVRYISILSVGDGQETANYQFAWQQPENLENTQVYGFNSSPRWNQIFADYDEFAVTGLKIEWIPSNYRGITGGGINSSVTSLWFSSDLNTYLQFNFSDDDLMRNGQLRMLDPTRKYKKYLSFKAYSKQMNYAWQDTQLDLAEFNNLSAGSSMMKFRYLGMPTNTTIGYVKLTYYAKFRGQRGIVN